MTNAVWLLELPLHRVHGRVIPSRRDSLQVWRRERPYRSMFWVVISTTYRDGLVSGCERGDRGSRLSHVGLAHEMNSKPRSGVWARMVLARLLLRPEGVWINQSRSIPLGP